MNLKKTLSKILPYRIVYWLKRSFKKSFDERNLIYDFLNYKQGVMFDVGSMDGSSFMPFLLKKWEVYAFEPDTTNYNTVVRNLSNWNFKVNLINKAVSDKAEKKLFYTSTASTGIPSLLKFNEHQVPSHELETIVLSDFIEQHEITSIDFLKIDVEGYDLMALKGVDFDAIKPRVILCEFEDLKTKHLGYSTQDMAQFLQDKGYALIYSIWHPIEQYGIEHRWKKLSLSIHDVGANDWGNILAFADMGDFEKFKAKHL